MARTLFPTSRMVPFVWSLFPPVWFRYIRTERRTSISATRQTTRPTVRSVMGYLQLHINDGAEESSMVSTPGSISHHG